jgi:hypothetical protein
MLEIVRVVLPMGSVGWEAVEKHFVEWAGNNGALFVLGNLSSTSTNR